MSAPVRFDNVTFSDSFDFDGFARRQLLDEAGTGAMPSDVTPVDWLLRAYGTLRGTPFGDSLSRGVAKQMTAPEPFVRFQTMVFLENFPHAAGAERAEQLVAQDRSLFKGVSVPPFASNLEWNLLRVLGARAMTGSQNAQDLAKAEVVKPGQASGVVAGVVGVDPDWVVAHSEEIVRSTPHVLGALLYLLQGSGRDVASVGERLARLSLMPNDKFKAAVQENVRDPARQRILSALPS